MAVSVARMWHDGYVAPVTGRQSKCIAGQQAEAKRRILDAQPEDALDGPPDHQPEDSTPETLDDDGGKS